MHTLSSPHPATDPQHMTDNTMSSGAPEASAENDSSEPRLEGSRTNTPASDISSDDAADLHISDETQDATNTTEEQALYKRELRPIRGIAPCTWIDLDTTGDFDPDEEARKARSRRKKTKTSHREYHDRSGEKHTDEPAIEPEDELPLPPAFCIRFSSSTGKVAFSDLCAKLDSQVKPSCDNWTAGYQLRKRKRISEEPFSGVLGTQATGVRVIASEQPSDFTNHPVARGCFDCLAIASRCSLLDNEHSWPCEECKINDNDCQLVKEPEVKMACTHCRYLGKKQKWLVCSFEYDQDPSSHPGRCAECQESGHRLCTAGPRPGHVRTRIRIGSDGEPYTNKPSNDRKAPRKTTCLRCMETRRVCSFNAGTLCSDGDVCTACDMAGEACEPLGSRAPQHQHRQSPRDSVQEDLEELDVEESDAEVVPTTLAVDQTFTHRLTTPPNPPTTTLDPEQGDAKPHVSAPTTPINYPTSAHGRKPPLCPQTDSPRPISGTTKTVRTKLCHPVRFDYRDPTGDGSAPCHFCACAAYSVIGLEERTTEVIEWDDGRGWEEVSGGHWGEDTQSTQICPGCTLARMKIMVCDEHALRRIPGVGDRERDLGEALQRLLDGAAAHETWCGVCCNLAALGCCLEQRIGEDRGGEGCGLALCEACVVDLRRCDGSLEAMLQVLEDEPSEERPLGLRADYGLLKQDGLLMGFVQSSA